MQRVASASGTGALGSVRNNQVASVIQMCRHEQRRQLPTQPSDGTLLLCHQDLALLVLEAAQHDAQSVPVHQFVGQVLYDAQLRPRFVLAAALALLLAPLDLLLGAAVRKSFGALGGWRAR